MKAFRAGACAIVASTSALVASFAMPSPPAGALVGLTGGSYNFTISFTNGGVCQVQDAMYPNSSTDYLGSTVSTFDSVSCTFGASTSALAQIANPVGNLYCSQSGATYASCAVNPQSGTTYDSVNQVLINATGIAAVSGVLNANCSYPEIGNTEYVSCNFNNSVLYE